MLNFYASGIYNTTVHDLSLSQLEQLMYLSEANKLFFPCKGNYAQVSSAHQPYSTTPPYLSRYPFAVCLKLFIRWSENINLLLTEREGRTGEYWPEVVAVRTERSEVRTKTTEGQYSPVRLEQARLVSSLLYGTRVMLVSKLPAFENKKYTSYDHFHGNGPYGKIPTKKEPIRTPGFTPRLPCHIIIVFNLR